MHNAKLRGILHNLMLVVGVALMVASYRYFFIDNQIAPGGFTGIATVLFHKFGFPVGIAVILMNIPLFLIGMRLLGLKFGVKSLLCMTGMSALIDLLPGTVVTKDLLLASIYGGVLLGVGLGMVLFGGASTGGSDLLAKILNHRFPHLRIAWILFAIDTLVIFGAGLMLEPAAALYSLVGLFISSKMIDVVQEGLSSAKMALIVSKCPAEIASRVLQEMSRGCTGLSGHGMYSGTERQVLLCVVYRTELATLKDIVQECDAEAFVIVSDVHEALGEGFVKPPQGKRKAKDKH